MSEDNTIEYTIEENDNEMKPGNPNTENKPNLRRAGNGLSGIPPDVLNKLPQSFFGNDDIQHGDALQEFMLKHKANTQNNSNDSMNMHPNEYFRQIIMKEKTD